MSERIARRRSSAAIVAALSLAALVLAGASFGSTPQRQDSVLTVDLPRMRGAISSLEATTSRGGRVIVHRAGAGEVGAYGAALPTVVLHHPGYAGLEPTLGIDPQGRVFVGAALDNGFLAVPHVIRTSDQGATWKDVSSHVGPVGVHTYSSDPYLYVDPATGRVFHDDLILPCQLLSSSGNAGKTWRHSVVACDQADHQTIFAGPPTISTPVTYPNVVYDCAIGGGALSPSSIATACDRSLDGGRTFAPVRPPFVATLGIGPGAYGIPGFCDGATGHGFVGPDGTVYVPRGWCGQPWLAMSRNEGLTWKRVQVASNGVAVDPSGGFDHEAGAVADAAGNVYYFWVAHDRLPYLSISRNHGKTWSPPMMVGPPGLNESTLPAVAIGGTGKIAMAYMGTTNSPGMPFPNELNCPKEHPLKALVTCPVPHAYDHTTWNGYITTTVNALDASPTFVTSSINDPSDPLIVGACGPIRCQQVFDFIGIQVAPDGTAWGAFVDACLPSKVCKPLGDLVVPHLVGGPSLR